MCSVLSFSFHKPEAVSFPQEAPQPVSEASEEKIPFEIDFFLFYFWGP